jgi:hypothetical protein
MSTDWDAVNREIEELRDENAKLRAALNAVIHAYGSQEDGGSGGMDKAIALAKLVAGPVDTSDIPEAGEDFFMASKLRTPSDPM